MMAASWWALFLTSLVLVCWALGGCRRLWALRACVVSAWTFVDSAIQQRHALASTLLDALCEPPHVDPRLFEAALDQASRAAAADGCEGRQVDAGASTCAAALPQAVAVAMQGWQCSEPALSAASNAFSAAVDRYKRTAAEAPTGVLLRLFGFEPAARWWGTLR